MLLILHVFHKPQRLLFEFLEDVFLSIEDLLIVNILVFKLSELPVHPFIVFLPLAVQTQVLLINFKRLVGLRLSLKLF